MNTFKIVDCPKCGEEFNILVTKTCPECKTIYSKKVEDDIEEIRPAPVAKEISVEEQLAQIQYLLYKIDKNVAFFSWVLLVSLVSGFIWFIYGLGSA
jgi:hypothetical protein